MELLDLHTHTNLSDANFSPAELVKTETAMGLTCGVSDHVFCGGIYTLSDVKNYLDVLDEYPVYRAVETNMEHDSSLPDELDDRLDYVIAAVHSMPDGRGGRVDLGAYFANRTGYHGGYRRNHSPFMARYYLAYILREIEKKFENHRVDIFAHCTALPCYDELQGTRFLRDWENAVIALCVKHNVAIELSGLFRVPNLDLVLRAKAAGAVFSTGSDCHEALQIGDLRYPEQIIEAAGLTSEDLFVPRRVLRRD